MIKQKNYQKITALGKRRVNVFRLEQRVATLEKQQRLQARANIQAHSLRQLDVITTEEILRRVGELEQIVLPKSAVKKVGILDRFWAWLAS
ncbi:hypothetical protein ACE4RU_07770 [Actinobacillus seminis]|uniref:hypothetical protein n=1 Tax=Actinobacillus seminis TaxID=722 RepID=UPI003B92D72C